MRNVVSVSLPDNLLEDLRLQARKDKFPSVSEYVRHLIRLHNTEKLYKELGESRKEILAGEGIEWTGPLKDLVKKHH